MGTARVQAATVQLRDEFVLSRFGVEQRQHFRARCSPALREVLSGQRTGWVDFDLFIESMELIDSMFGSGDNSMAWEVGGFALQQEQGTWKSLVMRHLRPSMVVSVAKALWSSHYDGGRLMSRVVGPQAVVVSILDFPQPHRAHCLAIAGWMHASLKIGPRRDPGVDELSCRCRGGASCDFRMTWED